MNGCRSRVVAPAQLLDAADTLLAEGGRMQMAYGWFPQPGRAQVLYLTTRGVREPFELWRVQLDAEGTLPSLAQKIPLLGWYEREMQDLLGLKFTDHPEPYPLVLHEGATAALPPLDPGYPAGTALAFRATPILVPEVENGDVQYLPFGPVRADVVESAQFVFFYIGEGILHYHPRLFYKHRGMEQRFAGLRPELGVVLAERVSGIGSFAHALAYCQAVEAATGCEVPERARYLRVVLAELERLYNHCHYFAHLCKTTTLKVGEAEGSLLEERVKQLNALHTGSRFLRGVLAPGGLRRDVEPGDLLAALEDIGGELQRYLARLEDTNSHLDRLITTGVLPRVVAFDQGATGPVERASGLDRDLRRDHPYAAYGELHVGVPVRESGDAHGRAQVRMEETQESLALIRQALDRLPSGAVRAPCRTQMGVSAEGLGWAESPRGSLYYAVHLGADGRVQRTKVKSPSFSNWRVFPLTVHDTNMMDYAINEASFGLGIAGCDR
ncbi:MAG TPA: nickel-dependent hydrogenase large subunit [Gammaproteobacteria bacterium]|nr:nickel-dependent hydrogenase large subunit [Gammaproteobacteria bacterium]